MFLLVFRIWYLQIYKKEYFDLLSTENFVFRERLKHERGQILDNSYTPLARNRPSFDLMITPAFVIDTQKTLLILKELIGEDHESFEKIYNALDKSLNKNPFSPVIVKKDISYELFSKIETSLIDFDGISIQTGTLREYPNNASGAHLIGYMNEINRKELKKLSKKAYYLGDQIGRLGLERKWEEILRGIDGYNKIIVTASGHKANSKLQELYLSTVDDSKKNPKNGYNIILSINNVLQHLAFELLKDHAGAVAALDPRTGDTLVLASSPSFNPNDFALKLNREIKSKLDKDPLQPWVDRIARQHYAPGSTFKVITALAALEENKTNAKEKIYCPGYYRYGKRRWKCWKRSGHGSVNLEEALKGSCDVFFYIMGERLGIDKIAKWSKAFGLAKPTGLNYIKETPGIIPDRKWYKKRGGYHKGFSLNASIGQGDVTVTPIQLALVYSTFANGGHIYKPRIIKRIESPTGKIYREFKNESYYKIKIKPDNLKLIQNGLWKVVNEKGGTAFSKRLKNVHVSGKTGTAQVVTLSKTDYDNYLTKDHALFAAYAPSVNPEIAIAVIIEHGGHGGAIAAPIAMEIIKKYFEDKKKLAKY